MKELSIEQKAKRYDEAIEKFDVILNLNTVKESGTIFADDVRKILPELQESEDERIRKALKQYFINSFQNNGVAAICGVHIKDVLAWLEKQGEQKPAWSEEDLTKLKSAITLLEHPAVISDNTGIQEKTIDFLKSLKDKVQPQSHWKPSEGQMKALGNCVCKTWFDKDMLKTLYNDLQNL